MMPIKSALVVQYWEKREEDPKDTMLFHSNERVKGSNTRGRKGPDFGW